MGKQFRDNQVLSGAWAQVWFGGELLAECTGITAKITETRGDVQMGIDVGSKLLAMKGEGTVTLHHVYTTSVAIMKEKLKGKDPRIQIIAALSDPDAVQSGGKPQTERWALNECAITETQLFNWVNGEMAKKEMPFTFPPSKMVNLDEIK